MTLAVLINGAAPADPDSAIAVDERGLHYGDGLFETALLCDGRVRFLEDHLARLNSSCERLGIPAPSRQALLSDIERVTGSERRAVLKIIITRGVGRGYRPASTARPTRIVALYAAPEAIKRDIAVQWCATPLGRNARLAGMKHLNRLEQVLAQAELQDGVDEGLMLDTEGELVCATSGNVFILRDGALITPDLRFCGVLGIMRRRVLRLAEQLGVAATEEPLWPHDLDAASEVFVTNAVRGVQSVVSLDGRRWADAPMAQRLREALLL
ncbi:MAG TPA: aminodeoxychorismate lyase [Steroidobacter sp.]|jgi:4-amino-4-deoxychorismate lyase|nr:aminodeoxychorismate lyase [Steroidobacter sp.]